MVKKKVDSAGQGEVVPENDIVDEQNELSSKSELSGGGRQEEQDDVTESAEKDQSQVIADLEEEKRKCQDNVLRMAAELENFKKRMQRERETALKFAEENILKELLPTIDNLERALDHEGDDYDLGTMLEGVQLTLKGLHSTIAKFGLTPLESVGQPFDPNFHEALVMEENSDVPAQSVIREFEKGYQYKDRLLRAAKVVVSKGSKSE